MPPYRVAHLQAAFCSAGRGSPAFSSGLTPFSSAVHGLPISAGWNSNAAHMVVTSDSARSLPMLEVPGWLESERLPKAAAVVRALQLTPRLKLDSIRLVCPARHAMM